MKITDVPFGTTDWATVEATEHPGLTGRALWRTRQFGDIRVRLVEYSPGYLADHWCDKGHILFVVAGELTIEHRDGTSYELGRGMSWHVADEVFAPHRVLCKRGATVFIVD